MTARIALFLNSLPAYDRAPLVECELLGPSLEHLLVLYRRIYKFEISTHIIINLSDTKIYIRICETI